jgi:hypothetical protein
MAQSLRKRSGNSWEKIGEILALNHIPNFQFGISEHEQKRKRTLIKKCKI